MIDEEERKRRHRAAQAKYKKEHPEYVKNTKQKTIRNIMKPTENNAKNGIGDITKNIEMKFVRTMFQPADPAGGHRLMTLLNKTRVYKKYAIS